MLFFFFKTFLIFFSAASTFLSLVFIISPKNFSEIERFLGQEFGSGEKFVTVLEGEIDFINAWVFRNRFFFGPLLAILAAINTKNAFFF